jgi:hypothetical protein
MAASPYSNPVKAQDVLFEMFLSYVKDQDFGNLSQSERKAVADQVLEIKNTMIPNNGGDGISQVP